jgi:hypothetical protein
MTFEILWALGLVLRRETFGYRLLVAGTKFH